MIRKIRFGGNGGAIDQTDHLDSFSGQDIRDEKKSKSHGSWIDYLLHFCQIFAFAQFLAIIFLLMLSFSTENKIGPIPTAVSTQSSNAAGHINSKLLVTSKRGRKSYIARFEGAKFALGTQVRFVPKLYSSQDASAWVMSEQAVQCGAQIVDISQTDNEVMYLVVVDGWSGDAAVWLHEQVLEVTTYRAKRAVCALPATPLARPAFENEKHSTCSDKMQEFCMIGFGTHEATAADSNFNCYQSRDGSGEVSPDFYRAQDLMAELGHCPFSAQMKWRPDSTTHPLCSTALGEALRTALEEVPHTAASTVGNVEVTNSILLSSQMSVHQSSGHCPSPHAFRWTPDQLTYPSCSTGLGEVCANGDSAVPCDFPPAGKWTGESRMHLARLQDSGESTNWSRCPYSGLVLWAPLDGFYPSCMQKLAEVCLLRGGAEDVCQFDFNRRFANQKKLASTKICPHPSQEFMWPYKSPTLVH